MRARPEIPMTQTFETLRLMEPILRALREQRYEVPTPIQAEAIPPLIEGRDLLGIAQTGTGKTAAFALPILDFLARDPQPPRPGQPTVLVLTPTRELAAQIGESFRRYGRYLDIGHTVIFGGVGQGPQTKALRRGVDVVVATPGRLLDLTEQGHIDLRAVEVFVLDEADRMLDMGFIHAVHKVIDDLPRERQSLLFSATMPRDIRSLADAILIDPVRIEVAPPATTVDRVTQSVLHVEKRDKRALLGEVLRDPALERVLVFTRTKHGANRVVRYLRSLDERADVIHGGKSQGARERALEGFRTGRLRVLVATDIAARGLDVREITHVINLDLPNVPESYVHRIGRTARAGRNGTAISFCAQDEREHLRAIEQQIRMSVPVVEHPALETRSGDARDIKPARAKRAGRARRGPRENRRSRRGAARHPVSSNSAS